MIILEGVILKEGTVLGDNGKKYNLPKRGTDDEGYPEVLINAKNVGGKGTFSRQSVKPYIGMRVRFVCNGEDFEGYNYEIIGKRKE